MTRRAASLVLVLALVAAVACGRGAGTADWLAGAEAAHEEADRKSAGGDVDGAVTELLSAARAAAPEGARAEDARIVRQDLFYRAAALEMSRNRGPEAVRLASLGLELGRGTDVFTSNLLIARGQALEAEGDPRGASRDYHEALVITEALFEASLGGATRNP